MAHSVDAAAKANALSSSVVLAAKKTGVAGLEWWMFLHLFAFRAIFCNFYTPILVYYPVFGEDRHLGPSHIPPKRDSSLNSENFFRGGKHVGTLPREWPKKTVSLTTHSVTTDQCAMLFCLFSVGVLF